MSRFAAAVAAVLLGCLSAAQALEVPLLVTERAGFDRIDNHVNSGVPLPEGACKDVGKFALYDAAGKAVPAQFVVRERWLKDDTIRFMTVHFTMGIKAGEAAKFTVKDDGGGAAPATPVTATEADGAVTVNTGAVNFTVKKGDWHLFDTVEALGAAALAGPGTTVFKAEYGSTPVSREQATPPGEGEVKDAQAVVKEVAIEESGPVRAVVLVRGAFQEGGTDKLDFQARYYAVAGSPAVRVAFTVINRQGKAWDQFVGIRSLGFELPLKATGELNWSMGASEGDDLSGKLAKDDRVVMLQPSSVEYLVSGKTEARGKCKDLVTKRVGWISLAGQDAGATAAVRWFWQLHPKGLAASGDGALKVYLVPPQKEKVQLPEEEYSEPLKRIDLYTGGAKTHEMLFAFGKPSGAAEARARAMGVMEPLFAACPPDWYCQKTWAFGKIYDVNLDNFRPEVRDLVRKYEINIDRSFTTVMARMSGKAQKDVKIVTPFEITEKDEEGKPKDTIWCSAQKCEEYGWMNFGSHVEHGSKVKVNDALNTQWDGNYYDFPRACLIRFVRTGMMHYLDAAAESAWHLADIDMAHWHPKNPELSGIEHVCPNAGHFRTFWPGRAFQPSGNVHSAKSQSLYELYCLTGDGWLREAALLSGTYLVNHKGGNVRGMGNRITGLYCAYRSSRDDKYKTAWAADVIDRTAKSAIDTGGTGRWDQAWQYGLGCEAMRDYFDVTGDVTAAKGIKFAVDSLMNHGWDGKQRKEYDGLAGFTLPVFGYAYEMTGDIKYLRHGIERLEVTGNNFAGRSKTFAQLSRISPQLLYYLATAYQPPKPPLEGKETADPVENAFKEAPAGEKPEDKKAADIGEM